MALHELQYNSFTTPRVFVSVYFSGPKQVYERVVQVRGVHNEKWCHQYFTNIKDIAIAAKFPECGLVTFGCWRSENCTRNRTPT